jgi:two-component system OmpR family sensor kinase
LAASGPAIIEADEQRIEQVIRNLLQNALVHTPAGTAVDVQVERSAHEATLRVRDEGPGLDAEQASRVFDRFYRGTTSGRESGSGLGLFIVATVAKSLGGRVSVVTAPGQGAAFTVVFPELEATTDSRDGGRDTGPVPPAGSASDTGVPSGTPETGAPPTPSSAPTTRPDPSEVPASDAVHH